MDHDSRPEREPEPELKETPAEHYANAEEFARQALEMRYTHPESAAITAQIAQVYATLATVVLPYRSPR